MQKKLLFICLIFPLLVRCQTPQKAVYTNALINESSPYLRQHAHNPVNWQAWQTPVLQKAQLEHKLLLISIGYAACHWCHVMERESFMDTAVAAVMNQHFINIKIDREERPDIDNVYMTACQMLKGGGCGWPLSIIALPDGKPVWVGTYMPKNEWVSTLNYFVNAQKNDLAKLETYATQLQQGIQSVGQLDVPQTKPIFEAADVAFSIENILKNIDTINGGQRGAPKFPMPALFEFLLNYMAQNPTFKSRNAVFLTLDKMANGGIYDHLGGGFARYSTDSLWQVPHFEKMLYDNGQLISLYSHAFQITKNEDYKRIIEQTMAFVQTHWLSKEGGFYSSFDADSEGREGAFYTWKKREIDSLLGRNALIFNDLYNITEGGNFENGENILYKKTSLTDYGIAHQLTKNDLEKPITASLSILQNARKKRPMPLLDDKILTAWNGLMLSGCVAAYRALGTPHYLAIALKNGQFLLDKQLQTEGRLNRNYQNSKSQINAFLEDYAYTISAFIALYEVTFDEKWLKAAEKMSDYVLANFSDNQTALLHFTSNQDAALVARPMNLSDDVLPNANAVFALSINQLGHFLDKKMYQEKAVQMLQQMYPTAITSGYASSYFSWCKLLAQLVKPPFEVAIVGNQSAVLRDELMRHYLPNALILGGNTEGSLSLLEGKLQQGETYIYVCQNGVCKQPVKTVAEALHILRTSERF